MAGEKRSATAQPDAAAMVEAAFGGRPETFAAFDDATDKVVMGFRLTKMGKLLVARWKDGVPLADDSMTRRDVTRRFDDGDWTPMGPKMRAECETNRYLTPRRLVFHRARAKALVSTCFRNGPVEDVHAGRRPGNAIDDEVMRELVTTMVDRVFTFLLGGPLFVAEAIARTSRWDVPKLDDEMIERLEVD